MWADEACTIRPTGELDHVFVQVNRNVNFGDRLEYGDMELWKTYLEVLSPNRDYPTDPFYVNIYVDYASQVAVDYIAAGTVVRCAAIEAYDLTGCTVSFGPVISDTPTIVENSLYAQQINDVGDAVLACRNSNGEAVVLLRDENINAYTGVLSEDTVNAEFEYTPSPAPLDANVNVGDPAPIELSVGPIPIGYKTLNFCLLTIQELYGAGEWGAWFVLNGVDISGSRTIVSGDETPFVFAL